MYLISPNSITMTTLQGSKTIQDKSAFVVTTAFLLISMICLIVNYSVNHSISWSLFPIGALIVVWATTLPVLVLKNNKLLGLFAGLAITLVPYLFLIQSQTSAKGWVLQLALPIALLFLFILGISLIGFTYMKANKFYPVALAIFLFGVVGNFGVGLIISRFLDGRNWDDVPRVYTMSLSAMISFIFIIAGYMKGNKVKASQDKL